MKIKLSRGTYSVGDQTIELIRGGKKLRKNHKDTEDQKYTSHYSNIWGTTHIYKCL